EYYATHITRSGWFLAGLIGLIARQSPHQLPRTTVDISGSRLHDREENLQAASGKIGGHLFETQILLVAHVSKGNRQQGIERLQQMAGAFGAFTQSRLAIFSLHR